MRVRIMAVMAAAWLGAAAMADAQTSAASNPAAAPQDGRQRLGAYLDALAADQLAERARRIASLRTRADALRRQEMVRRTVLDLIGGLPTDAGPLNARLYGTIQRDGYRVEKITYDSLPGYRVSAHVFVPPGPGPFPAVIMAPGHGLDGKIGNFGFGANLARAGVLVLSYDVVSEGERLQHYDPETGASKVGPPTGEHSMAFQQTLPVGDHVSRYFIQDGVRGLDYLSARPDVDAQRLGAFGCSGGGTVTSYLAALDPRVKATASACYINTYKHLLASVGPQDAEQTLPFFLERGLDLPDWVEAAAPRPYAIVSTTEDMFPFSGAKAAYEEARRFYGLMGAADRVQWITGPGGHGNLGPIAPQIVAFFTRWLNDDPAERPFIVERLPDAATLQVTPTGQVADLPAARSLRSVNRERAAALLPRRPQVRTPAELRALQDRLRRDVREVTRATARPGSPPPAVALLKAEARDGWRLETLALQSEPGITLDAVIAVPAAPGRKRTLLLLTTQPAAALTRPGGQLEQLARAGWVVLALPPRGAGGTEEIKSPLLGDWTLLSMRGLLVGKTVVGMRSDDAVRAVDWLTSRDDVNPAQITVYGVGALGPVALHAAVLDERLSRIYMDGSLTAYRQIVDRPLSRNVPETSLPGVLRRYDLPDLLLAVSPRPVEVVSPVDVIGRPMNRSAFDTEAAYVLAADMRLGLSRRVRWSYRNSRDPIVLP